MKKNLFEQKTLVVIFFLFINIIIMSTNIVVKDEQTLLEYSVGTIISPIQIVLNNSIEFIRSKWEKYFFKKNIYFKYRETKAKLFELKKENYLLNSKVEFLRRQINIEKIRAENFKVITQTKVVYFDKNFPFNSLIIDSGSLQNIKKNMLVINENFDLIGNITGSITPITSKVRLLTSKKGGIGAYISNIEFEGLLTGNNSKVCSFKYLVEGKLIKIGDKVFTSGTDGIFPEKIAIGKVINIKKGYLEQEIAIEPFYLSYPIKNLIVIEKIK